MDILSKALIDVVSFQPRRESTKLLIVMMLLIVAFVDLNLINLVLYLHITHSLNLFDFLNGSRTRDLEGMTHGGLSR